MPIEAKKPNMAATLRPIALSILAAFLVYSGLTFFSDFDAVGATMSKVEPSLWASILGLSLINYGLRFIRWEIYLQRLDIRIPKLQSLAYYLGGFAFTTTPGKVGEAVRSYYLKLRGVEYRKSLAALFAERLVDLIAIVLLALFSAMTFPDFRWPVFTVTALLFIALPFVHAESIHNFLNRQLGRMPQGKPRAFSELLISLLQASSTLLRSKILACGMLVAVIAWGAEGIALYLILDSLSVDIALELAVGIYALSILAGAISFIPGGLGTTEAVMVIMLTLTGCDTPTAVAATLISRISTLWFAVAIGYTVLAGLEYKEARKS